MIYFFISIFLFPINVSSQEPFSNYIEVISYINSLNESNDGDKLNILESNVSLFQENELTQFLYNWLAGSFLYRMERYPEAEPYTEKTVACMDENKEFFSQEMWHPYFSVYYAHALLKYYIDHNREDCIKRLEYAKKVYESASATSQSDYSLIIQDLEAFSNNLQDILHEAVRCFFSRDFNNAIPLLNEVLNFDKRYHSFPSETHAQLLNMLGMSYLDIKDFNNSEICYSAAVDCMDSANLKHLPLYRTVLDGLGCVYMKIHNYNKALLLFDKAKKLYENALDFRDDYLTCLMNMACCCNELGKNSYARTLVDYSVLQAKRNLSDTSTTQNYNVEFFNHEDVAIFQKYSKKNKLSYYISALSTAGSIYSDLGYKSDAIKLLKEAIKFMEDYKLIIPIPYNNIGAIYLEKSNFSQAVKWFIKSYELCRSSDETNEVGMNLALGLYLSKDSSVSNFCSSLSEKIRNNILDMFKFMSGEERAIYWKTLETYLPVLNLIIYESGNTDTFGTIYDNILEAKGLLLRSTNAIRDAVLNSGNETDIADYIHIGQLKQQLLNEKDNETRESIEKEIESIDKRLTRQVNAYTEFTTSKTIHWEEVRNALSKDDVAIEFYNIPLDLGMIDSIHPITVEPRYCAILLRKGYKYPHIIPLCKESQLEELEKEDLYETDSLYNLIWQPLENELKGVKNIYFAADRELHKIGIEYAPISEKENIGDRYNLFRLSSTRVLAENKTKSKKESAVLYGGLKYDLDKDELIAESRSGDYHPTSSSRTFTAENSRYGVKYLPGTLKEVEVISQNFSSSPRLITDISGTEESFKSLAGSSTDIIHLATHGFFWNEDDVQKRDYVTFLNPSNRSSQSKEDKALMRSGLFFSGANIGLRGETLPDDVEDGVLTALELSNMNLGNVDIVVMSACESGLGETSGEGVFGLQRGFKLAGANTLLMSLWKVDDTATQILMTEFYKNYLSGNSKQQSLKLAQQSLRKNAKYSDPEYWAAFILLDGLN